MYHFSLLWMWHWNIKVFEIGNGFTFKPIWNSSLKLVEQRRKRIEFILRHLFLHNHYWFFQYWLCFFNWLSLRFVYLPLMWFTFRDIYWLSTCLHFINHFYLQSIIFASLKLAHILQLTYWKVRKTRFLKLPPSHWSVLIPKCCKLLLSPLVLRALVSRLSIHL